MYPFCSRYRRALCCFCSGWQPKKKQNTNVRKKFEKFSTRSNGFGVERNYSLAILKLGEMTKWGWVRKNLSTSSEFCRHNKFQVDERLPKVINLIFHNTLCLLNRSAEIFVRREGSSLLLHFYVVSQKGAHRMSNARLIVFSAKEAFKKQ